MPHLTISPQVRQLVITSKINRGQRFNYKICAVEEYSDSFRDYRQIGKAKVMQRIVNADTGEEMQQLWDNYAGFEGSIEDVRCGKPSIGQNLFVSCSL